MRVWVQKTRFDCGPVAVYNLARVLDLRSVRGGYRRHEARLRRATRCKNPGGSKNHRIFAAADREVGRAGYGLTSRRANWENVLTQMDRAPRGGRMPMGMLVFVGSSPRNEEAPLHVCPIWHANNGTMVWGANFVSGRQFSLLMAYGNGSWWPTRFCPTDEDLVRFWQVVKK